jgi:hypothetical protein
MEFGPDGFEVDAGTGMSVGIPIQKLNVSKDLYKQH